MTAPKPIPQVPAALCGLYPGATIRFPLNGAMVTGKANPFNAVYNNQVQTVHLVGGADGVAYSAVEIEKVDLLLDSPLAMCHAARWLSARWLIDLGATAPQWYTTNYVWVLRSATASGVMWSTSFGRHDWAHVKVDIDESTDPAAALAAACVALAPA